MARFLIFDTMAVNDSVNNLGAYHRPTSDWNTPGIGPIGQNLQPITPWRDYSAAYATALNVPPAAAGMNTADDGGFTGVSYPVRLFGSPAGDVRNITWEFCLTGGASATNVCWYQEFNNERSVPFTWTARHMEPLPTQGPWLREQAEVIDASGLITHTHVVRTVTMNPGGELGVEGMDARVFPMTVHGMWVRLRVFSMTNLGLNANYYVDCASYPPGQRLRIYAVVGGYEQVAAMDPCAARGLLWDSSLVNAPLLWDSTNPGTNLGYTGTWPTW